GRVARLPAPDGPEPPPMPQIEERSVCSIYRILDESGTFGIEFNARAYSWFEPLHSSYLQSGE
ncbi:MAG TPA: hypothetical protein VGI22_03820, partial [Xanthobacteraceae bacterium]